MKNKHDLRAIRIVLWNLEVFFINNSFFVFVLLLSSELEIIKETVTKLYKFLLRWALSSIKLSFSVLSLLEILEQKFCYKLKLLLRKREGMKIVNLVWVGWVFHDCNEVCQ